MPDEKHILKYLKVKALAEQGTGGERVNAQRIVAKLEREDPELRAAAEAYLRKQREQEEGPPGPTPPPGVWPKDGGWSNRFYEDVRTGNWENIFQWAGVAFDQAYGFVETAANVSEARSLAEHLDSSLKVSRTGNVLLTLRMPMWVYERSVRMNAVQRQIFRQAMHDLLDSKLDEFLD